VTGSKVAIAVTSGTAGAHLLPALIEAAESDVSLVAITADRPEDLINTGANQTIDQLQLFSAATNNILDLSSNWPLDVWQSELRATLSEGGVIHLNPRFAEPLVPKDLWQPEHIEQSVSTKHPETVSIANFVTNKRGVVVSSTDCIQHAGDIASKLNWPLIAEPTGTSHSNLISFGPLVLEKFVNDIEYVITVGRVGLSRKVNSLISNKPRISVHTPTRLTKVKADFVVHHEINTHDLVAVNHEWLNAWLDEASEYGQEVNRFLDDSPLSGLSVAGSLLSYLKSTNHLHAAASLSLRDLDYLMQPNSIGLITANRGVNGIDGIVATAIGSAIAWQQAGNGQSYCLLGDIALLHDLSSLTLPATESMPNLRLIVVDNNGGGVFHTIEQRGVAGFERVFGTPHSVNLKTLLAGFGLPITEIKSKADLIKIYQEQPGLSVALVTGIDRENEAELRQKLSNLMHEELL
jgi:2-succinyl-5-enolpyruvyl-6-hydroxy-3-cyclohexene-1-carboxylate synthase